MVLRRQADWLDNENRYHAALVLAGRSCRQEGANPSRDTDKVRGVAPKVWFRSLVRCMPTSRRMGSRIGSTPSTACMFSIAVPPQQHSFSHVSRLHNVNGQLQPDSFY